MYRVGPKMTYSRSTPVLAICLVVVSLAGCLSGQMGPSTLSDAAQTSEPTADGGAGSEHPVNASESVWIRPGMKFFTESPQGFCTLGFLLEEETTNATFALTAGHCVDEGVETIHFENGTAFGAVAVVKSEGVGAGRQDWALIRIDSGFENYTSPTVRHWTGPTGVSPAGSLNKDDWICFFGQNHPTPVNPGAWSHHRCGSFDRYRMNSGAVDHLIWRLVYPGDPDHPLVWGYLGGGDSGGPVIDYDTGQALGITTTTENLYWQVATAVYDVMDELAEMGYDLDLMTAPYDPPPPDSLP